MAAALFDSYLQEKANRWAIAFQQKRGGDLDALQSAASFGAMKKCETYNPNSGATLTTWCYWGAFDYMFRELKKYRKQRKREVTNTSREGIEEEPMEWFNQVLDQLSDDAEVIVSLLMEQPSYWTFIRQEGMAIREQLRESLRQRGWVNYRITNTFREIKQAIN